MNLLRTGIIPIDKPGWSDYRNTIMHSIYQETGIYWNSKISEEFKNKEFKYKEFIFRFNTIDNFISSIGVRSVEDYKEVKSLILLLHSKLTNISKRHPANEIVRPCNSKAEVILAEIFQQRKVVYYTSQVKFQDIIFLADHLLEYYLLKNKSVSGIYTDIHNLIHDCPTVILLKKKIFNSNEL